MNSHRRFVAIGIVFLSLVLISVACGSRGATVPPSAPLQTQPTSPPEISTPVQAQQVPPGAKRCERTQPGAWDCSVNGRKVLFSGIPDGITAYQVPYDEEKLLQKPTEQFKVVIVIVADIQFYDAEGKLVTDFKDGATLELGYTTDDVTTAEKQGYTESQLIPIYTNSCVPPENCDPLPWRPFQNYKPDPENKQAIIQFTSWLDQPTGFGAR